MGKFFQFVIIPSLVALSYFLGGAIFQDIKPTPPNPTMPQIQIKTPGNLIGPDGSLEEVGYMTAPIRAFNEESLTPWQQIRLKRWDYFDVITDKVAITFAIADIYYLGDIRLNIFDYTTRQYKTYKKSYIPGKIPRLAPTSYRLTNESLDDNILFTDGGFTLKIENFGKVASGKHNIRKVSITADEIDVKLDLTMGQYDDQEGIFGVIPLTPEKKNFFYTVKIGNMLAEGSLKVGDKTYELTKKNANSFIDWARGVWNYDTYWVFVRGQGFLDGKRFSLNLVSGYGHNETMKATEDGFIVDKKLYKLNPIEPVFDDNNLMNPWTFKTMVSKNGNPQECDIVFAPHFVDEKVINLIVGKNSMRVTYGQFSGWVSDEKGNKYNFENLNGYVEVFKARW